MSGEFVKSTTIKPAVVGRIADPDDYNKNIAGQSAEAIVGIDDDGNFADVDLGDETLATVGALINNIKVRDGGLVKIYNASGVFQRDVNLGQATKTLLGQSRLRNQITIGNNAADSINDIDFSGGNFVFDDGSGEALVAAMTKRIDANWAAGTNQGGLDTGTVAAYTPYYLFAIYNPSTLVSDYLISASKDSPLLPSGFTKKSYIAALITDASANIRNGIWNFGNGIYRFDYKDGVLDFSKQLTTSYVNETVSVPEDCHGIFQVFMTSPTPSPGDVRMFVKSTNATSVNLSTGACANLNFTGGSEIQRYCPSSQVSVKVNAIGSMGHNASLETLGWIEYL